MSQQVNNIEASFQSIRRICMIVILCCLVATVVVVVKSLQLVQAAQTTVYVLSNSKALQAFSADRKDNIPVEAKDHVKVFHQLFFNLDPDEKLIESNIGQALYLADASAKKQFDNLKEQGFYTGIIAGNISQSISIDSVLLHADRDPMYFRCYATQTVTRSTSVVIRSLVTEGFLRSIARSDNNPHGFLIERWTTLDNRDIQVKNR